MNFQFKGVLGGIYVPQLRGWGGYFLVRIPLDSPFFISVHYLLNQLMDFGHRGTLKCPK